MVEKVKVTYKGESKMIPKNYVANLKGAERQYGTKISDKPFVHKNIISKTGAEKIIMKGKGAYFNSKSGGSRPNQTPYSWGLARLASVIMNGPARKIDKDIWEKYKIKK